MNHTLLNHLLRYSILVVLALATGAPARAGGYIISEQDSEISGRAGAGAALTTTPSAIFYNPANLTALKGLQARAGLTVLLPRWRFEPQDPGAKNARTINESSLPPNASISYNLGDLGFGTMAAGVGFYVPYGSSFRWPRNWVGREQIQEISLRVYEIAPTIALQPSKMFSIGAGLRVLPGDVYLRQAVRFGTQMDGQVEAAGTGTAVGASAGISIWGFENLSLALTWRSPVILKMNGQSDADFPAPFDTQAFDRDVRTRIRLPQVFRLGAAYDVIPGVLNFSADLQFQQWSAFQQLKLVFTNPDGSEDRVVSEREAQDSITFSIGGEYVIFEGLAVRAGYAYDERILPEHTVNAAPPDSDRHVMSVGLSYVWDKWLGVHFHHSNIFFTERTTNTAALPGTYSGGHGGGIMAFSTGITLSAAFDIAPLFTPAPEEVPASIDFDARVDPGYGSDFGGGESDGGFEAAPAHEPAPVEPEAAPEVDPAAPAAGDSLGSTPDVPPANAPEGDTPPASNDDSTPVPAPEEAPQ